MSRRAPRGGRAFEARIRTYVNRWLGWVRGGLCDGSFGHLRARILVDVASCLLTAISPNGAGGTLMSYAATLSRAGNVYSVSSGALTGDIFGGTVGAAPTVTSISPRSGPPAGGTSVTIIGNNFTGV